MSYADKMHFSKSEYIEIKKLWLKTRKKQKRELGEEIWMYPFSMLEKYTEKEDGTTDFKNYEYNYDPSESDLDIDWMNDEINNYTVFNVSTRVELWLLKNFKLACIEREVRNQLDTFFYVRIPDKFKFNLTECLDFSVPDYIYSIERKRTKTKKQVSLWFGNGVDMIQNKFLLYGDNDVYQIIHEAKECISGDESYNYKIQFTFCGLQLVYKNGRVTYMGREIVIPYMRPDYYKVDIKHSYNQKDSAKYSPSQIIIGGDRFVGNLDCWKNPLLNRILFTEVTDCLKDVIKK